MNYHGMIWRLLLPCLALVVAGGCGPRTPDYMRSGPSQYSAVGGGMSGATIIEAGGKVGGQYGDIRKAEHLTNGVLVPDGQGGAIWLSSGQPMGMPPARAAEARELKLIIRELADQLFASPLAEDYNCVAALPVSFVNQDNLEETSAFGRYIAEQMFYEFNQRGLRTKEYRNKGKITLRGNEGDFYLTRKINPVTVDGANLVLVGTYYSDHDTIFVSARLIRGKSGTVVRSGLVTFPQTDLSRRMVAKKQIMKLEAGSVGIKGSSSQARGGAPVNPIDLGSDIH